MTDHPEVV